MPALRICSCASPVYGLRCIFSAIAAAWSATLPPALAIRAPVLRLFEQVIERLLRILQSARSGFDQPREIGGNDRLGQRHRTRLVEPFGGVFGEGAANIDDHAVAQYADATVRPENDDLHRMPPWSWLTAL